MWDDTLLIILLLSNDFVHLQIDRISFLTWFFSLKMSQSNQVGDIDKSASLQPENEATHATSWATLFNSRAKRKSSKTWSDMWNHFTKFVNEKGEQKAKSNYCNRDVESLFVKLLFLLYNFEISINQLTNRINR